MKNNYFQIFIAVIFCSIIITSSIANDVFNFDVIEIEIKENGNKFFGKKGGVVTTEDGIIIKAKNFDYTKNTNILIARENVEIIDKINNTIIYSQQITYFKNKELITAEGKSSVISENIELFADKLFYDKVDNIINAKNNVKIINSVEDYTIKSEEITYFKNDEKIFSKGPTKTIINNKYNFLSSDVTIQKNLKQISSLKNTTISDGNFNNYKLSNFL